MFNRPTHSTAFLAAALLCASPCTSADSFQEANALFKQGQHGLALEKINSHLANMPGDAKARFLKGLIVTEQGNIPDATKIYLDLTADYPEQPEPYNNLAALYAAQGQYDKAKLALEKAMRTHPSYATAHENLGNIYAKLASQAYDRALQPARGSTPVQTRLAMIQDLHTENIRDQQISAHISTAASQTCADPCKKQAEYLPITRPAANQTVTATKSPVAGNSSAVLDTVHAWAAAWSSQNVDRYLSFYANDFKTPGGESRAAWALTRKQRISAPKSIRVDIGKATVKLNDSDHATVKFRQSYSANHLKTFGNKTLLMVKQGGKWMIQEERAK